MRMVLMVRRSTYVTAWTPLQASGRSPARAMVRDYALLIAISAPTTHNQLLLITRLPTRFCAAITNYCASTPSTPTNANASSVAVNQMVNTTSTFQCNFGYAGQPGYTCKPSSPTAGVWVATSGLCSRIHCIPTLSDFTFHTCIILVLHHWKRTRVLSNRCSILYSVISNYCTSTPATPMNANASGSVVNQTVNMLTTFKCNFGYTGQPGYTCNQFNSTAGIWTATSGSCTRTQSIQFLVYQHTHSYTSTRNVLSYSYNVVLQCMGECVSPVVCTCQSFSLLCCTINRYLYYCQLGTQHLIPLNGGFTVDSRADL